MLLACLQRSYKSCFVLKLGVVLSLLCFVPLIHVSRWSNRVSEHVAGKYIIMSFALTIAACFSMTVDIAMDLCQRRDKTAFILEHLLLLVGIVFPAVLHFLCSYSSIDSFLGELYNSALAAQSVLVIATFSSMIYRQNSRIWSRRRLSFFLMIFTICQIIELILFRVPTESELVLMYFLSALPLAIYFYFYYQYGNWLQCKPEEFRANFSAFVYASTILFYCASTMFAPIAFHARPWLGSHQQFVIYSNIIVVLVAVVGTIIPGRVARTEVVEADKILQLKQSFFRYVSHEIRTPLNVASVGLTILEDNLLEAKLLEVGEEDERNGEVLHQILNAVVATTEVLNDFLLFEKLDSNLLVLEKSQVKPVKIVKKLLRKWGKAAIQSNKSFVIEPISYSQSILLTNQMLVIDKVRISHVLDHLADNALKVTPEEGMVFVTQTVVSNIQRDASHVMSTRKNRNSLVSIGTKRWKRPSYLRSIINRKIAPNNKKVRLKPLGIEKLSLHDVKPKFSSRCFHSRCCRGKKFGFFSNKSNSSSDSVQHWLRISITDQGPGLTSEILHKLFEERSHFDPTEDRENNSSSSLLTSKRDDVTSGLGLSIDQGIINLHGGYLSAFSEGAGKGSTFTVELPLVVVTKDNSSCELSGPSRFSEEQNLHSPQRRQTLSPHLPLHLNSASGISVSSESPVAVTVTNSTVFNRSHSEGVSPPEQVNPPSRLTPRTHEVHSSSQKTRSSPRQNSEEASSGFARSLSNGTPSMARQKRTSPRSSPRTPEDELPKLLGMKINIPGESTGNGSPNSLRLPPMKPRDRASPDILSSRRSKASSREADDSPTPMIPTSRLQHNHAQQQPLNVVAGFTRMPSSKLSSPVRLINLESPAAEHCNEPNNSDVDVNSKLIFTTNNHAFTLRPAVSYKSGSSTARLLDPNSMISPSTDSNANTFRFGFSNPSANSSFHLSSRVKPFGNKPAENDEDVDELELTTDAVSRNAKEFGLNPISSPAPTKFDQQLQPVQPVQQLQQQERQESAYPSQQLRFHHSHEDDAVKSDEEDDDEEDFHHAGGIVGVARRSMGPNSGGVLQSMQAVSKGTGKIQSTFVEGKTVLIVDDSMVNLKMTLLLFKKLHATCRQANNGQEAVEMIRQALAGEIPSIDMVLMDNSMPVMNGPDACRKMREIGYTNPIFGLTGHALNEDIDDYKSSGANHIFTKPLVMKEFKKVVAMYEHY